MMFWVCAGFYRSQYTTVMNAGPQKGIRSFNRSKITPAKMMSGWSYTSVFFFFLYSSAFDSVNGFGHTLRLESDLRSSGHFSFTKYSPSRRV